MSHARFAPSAADRWSVCQISTLPYDGPSCRSNDGYANAGTAAHAAAHDAISRRIDPMELVLEGAEYAGIVLTLDTAESISVYVDAVNKLIDQGYDFYLEQWVEAPEIHAECSGTADCMAWSEQDKHLIIADYKSGWDIVSPKSNQLAIYAIGALKELTERHIEIDKITTAIIQPLNADEPVALHQYTVAELKKVARRLSKATKEMNAKSGPHCKYCPHAGACETLDRFSEDAVFGHGSTPVDRAVQDIDPGRIAEILNGIETVKIWWKAVEAYAHQLITLGYEIPGYILADGISNRFYKDPIEAETRLHERFGDDIYEPRELRSPAQIEKVWPNAKPLMKELTDRRATGVKLKRIKNDSDD